MKTTVTIIALVISGLFANAQTPDTLIINIDDYANVCISTKDVSVNHKKTTSIDLLYKSFYYDFGKSNIKLKKDEYIDVFHKIDNGLSKIEIRKRYKKANFVYLEDDKIQKTIDFPIRIHLLNHFPPYEKITIYVKEQKYLKQLSEISFDSLRKSSHIIINDGFKNKIINQKYAYKFLFSNKNNSINTNSFIINKKKANNNIALHTMGGIFVAWSELQTFGPDIGFDLGLTLNKKQFQRYKTGVMYNFSVIKNTVDTIPLRWSVLTRLSLYFGINNSMTRTNEIRFGLCMLSDDYTNQFGPFFQYNIKNIGLRVDMPFTKTELKRMFQFNDLGGEIPNEDYSKYSMSFSIFYNF